MDNANKHIEIIDLEEPKVSSLRNTDFKQTEFIVTKKNHDNFFSPLRFQSSPPPLLSSLALHSPRANSLLKESASSPVLSTTHQDREINLLIKPTASSLSSPRHHRSLPNFRARSNLPEDNKNINFLSRDQSALDIEIFVNLNHANVLKKKIEPIFENLNKYLDQPILVVFDHNPYKVFLDSNNVLHINYLLLLDKNKEILIYTIVREASHIFLKHSVNDANHLNKVQARESDRFSAYFIQKYYKRLKINRIFKFFEENVQGLNLDRSEYVRVAQKRINVFNEMFQFSKSSMHKLEPKYVCIIIQTVYPVVKKLEKATQELYPRYHVAFKKIDGTIARCTHKDVIEIDFKLLRRPADFITMAIAHEWCHLILAHAKQDSKFKKIIREEKCADAFSGYFLVKYFPHYNNFKNFRLYLCQEREKRSTVPHLIGGVRYQFYLYSARYAKKYLLDLPLKDVIKHLEKISNNKIEIGVDHTHHTELSKIRYISMPALVKIDDCHNIETTLDEALEYGNSCLIFSRELKQQSKNEHSIEIEKGKESLKDVEDLKSKSDPNPNPNPNPNADDLLTGEPLKKTNKKLTLL